MKKILFVVLGALVINSGFGYHAETSTNKCGRGEFYKTGNPAGCYTRQELCVNENNGSRDWFYKGNGAAEFRTWVDCSLSANASNPRCQLPNSICLVDICSAGWENFSRARGGDGRQDSNAGSGGACGRSYDHANRDPTVNPDNPQSPQQQDQQRQDQQQAAQQQQEQRQEQVVETALPGNVGLRLDGQTLRVVNNTGVNTGFTYAWHRRLSTAPAGTPWTTITLNGSDTYNIQSGDSGYTISVVVTAGSEYAGVKEAQFPVPASHQGQTGSNANSAVVVSTGDESTIIAKLDALKAVDVKFAGKGKWYINKEGKTNWVRIGADAAGAAVVGTVAGILTNSIVKKNQLESGYEAVECVYGGGGGYTAKFNETFTVR